MSSWAALPAFPARSATGFFETAKKEARTISYGSTPVTIRRPRVSAEARRHTPRTSCRRISGASPELDKTMHELWAYARAFETRDFEPSLRALLGQGAQHPVGLRARC